MRKIILILALPVTIISQLTAQDTIQQYKIGIARINYIMMKLPEMKQIEAELLEFESQLKQMYQAKVNEYEKKFKYFDSKKDTLPQLDIKNLESDLINLKQSIINFENEAQYSFVQKQNSLINPIRKKVFNSINQLAEKHNYTLILNYDSDEFPVVLHYHPALDISDSVLSNLVIND